MTEITITGESLEEIRDVLDGHFSPKVEGDPLATLKRNIMRHVKMRTFINGGNPNASDGYTASRHCEKSDGFNAGAVMGCENLLELILRGSFDTDEWMDEQIESPRGKQFLMAYRGIL